jgi:hypothetical protein
LRVGDEVGVRLRGTEGEGNDFKHGISPSCSPRRPRWGY